MKAIFALKGWWRTS
ncbi:trp operon leader peptide [Shigella flexneri]